MREKFYFLREKSYSFCYFFSIFVNCKMCITTYELMK